MSNQKAWDIVEEMVDEQNGWRLIGVYFVALFFLVGSFLLPLFIFTHRRDFNNFSCLVSISGGMKLTSRRLNSVGPSAQLFLARSVVDTDACKAILSVREVECQPDLCKLILRRGKKLGVGIVDKYGLRANLRGTAFDPDSYFWQP